MLSEELLSRFKTEADVSKFLNQLPVLLLEKMFEEEMDARLGYEKNSIAGNNTGNSRNGSYPKKIRIGHGEAVVFISRDRTGWFESIAVSKFCMPKGVSGSDIEKEMREDSVLQDFRVRRFFEFKKRPKKCQPSCVSRRKLYLCM